MVGTTGWIRLSGLDDVSSFAHQFETLLGNLRDGNLRASPQLVDLVLAAMDHLRALIDAGLDGLPASAAEGTRLSQAMQGLLGGVTGRSARTAANGSAASAEENSLRLEECTYLIRFRPDESCFLQGHDPLILIKALAELGEVETTTHLGALPPLSELDPTSCRLSWEITLRTSCDRAAIEEILLFVLEWVEITEAGSGNPESDSTDFVGTTPEAPTSAAASGASRKKAQGSSAADQFLRVHVQKIDELVDLAGAIALAYASIAHKRGVAEEEDEDDHRLGSLVRRLQDESLGLRMVPIGGAFSRLKRLVRDLSRQMGKPVELTTFGEDTEIDRSIAEAIYDPLVHLIRNCIDHGLESKEERVRAGKPEAGKLVIGASQSNGEIRIAVRDDGRGLDRERILARARSRGLCGPDEEPDDQRVWAFIFEPGFSTSESITSVSGRGVGMDVVRTNVESVRGRVCIESEAGGGAEFSLHIPLTLAILDAMLVRVGSTLFAVPIETVVEIVQPAASQIIPSAVGGNDILWLRDEFVPILRLQDYYHLPRGTRTHDGQPLLALESAGSSLAIPIDDIVGQQQVVIKPLTGHLKCIRAASGCALLGSGDVALVLDTSQLVQSQERGQ